MEKRWWMSRWMNLIPIMGDVYLAWFNFSQKSYVMMGIAIAGAIFATGVIYWIGKRRRQDYERQILTDL
jgi:ABC-type Fe3+-siderophore transport system permease subunit